MPLTPPAGQVGRLDGMRTSMAVNTGIDGRRRRRLWRLAGWTAAVAAVLLAVAAAAVLAGAYDRGSVVVRRTVSVTGAPEPLLSKSSDPAHDAHRRRDPG